MNNEVIEALKNRRSIRKFKADQVPQDLLDTILEAGTYAATARGMQCPFIVSVQDPDLVARLDAMNYDVIRATRPEYVNTMTHPYYGAPTILIVLVPDGGYTQLLDGACVACNLMHAAYAVGLGTCWINRSKEMFESPEGKELLKTWGLPDNLVGACSLALGYPDGEIPTSKPRKSNYIVRV